MSEAITRAERHARRESAMEPGVGYCRECKRSWPCLYEQGQRDEHAKWSALIKDRIRDLQSCTKHDDCMGKADILLVILDDYDYGVAREEKS